LSEDFPVLAGFRAGSLLAGYRLEAQIGVGGMAVVFRARDERLDRLVALKILVPALTADSDFRRRFIAEPRAAAAVDDPHIGRAGSDLLRGRARVLEPPALARPAVGPVSGIGASSTGQRGLVRH
jgi:hypothetical protein